MPLKTRTGTAVWLESKSMWRIQVQKDGVRKSFYSSKPGRTGQREANAKADAWLDGGIHDSSKRVYALYELWLEDLSLTCGTSYLVQCRKYGDYYILPVCGHLRIEDLSEGHLQTVLDKAYRKGCLKKERQRTRTSQKPLSKKTLSTIRSIERSFVKWCRLHRYTDLTAEFITIPKDARLCEKNILQPAALRTLFSVDTRMVYNRRVFDDYIYAYRFAVSTGLRPGELLGLWYGDIKGSTVNLRRSENIYGEITSGKNENAIRSFNMNEDALAAYHDQVQLLRRQGVEINYNTPLFPVPSYRSLSKRWESYQRSNGIDPILSLYELRHTFVSVAAGVLTDSQLKMLVGHSKNMDTSGVYRHELEGQREALACSTSDAFKKAHG